MKRPLKAKLGLLKLVLVSIYISLLKNYKKAKKGQKAEKVTEGQIKLLKMARVGFGNHLIEKAKKGQKGH